MSTPNPNPNSQLDLDTEIDFVVSEIATVEARLHWLRRSLDRLRQARTQTASVSFDQLADLLNKPECTIFDAPRIVHPDDGKADVTATRRTHN
ncbi:hypothetical protein [Pseudoclavibacter soli]|uniref:hypothetical protein n=1 Tax=Pseudoclavibacter soli TaxID=452623 RepID=UPI00048948F7|nr:hypothetical protein [Pseudoclavibacter soli]